MKNIIKDRRLELGLTMKYVADAVGVSEATVSRWESGDIADMKRNRIINLANVLKISPLDILDLPSEEKQPLQPEGLSQQEQAILTAFRALSPAQQEFVLQMLSSLPPSKGSRGSAE